MFASLDELIESRKSALRSGNSRADRNSYFRSNGYASHSEGPVRRNESAARRSKGYNPYWRSDANTSLNRNVYDVQNGPQTNRCDSITNIYPIVISNLDSRITSSDIQELFGIFGLIKSANVHYDICGNSMRTADVVYESKTSAIQAIGQFNNMLVKGLRIRIEHANSMSTVSYFNTRVNSPALMDVRITHDSDFGLWSNDGNNIGFHDTHRGNIGRRRKRGGRRIKMFTKEELDIQLDNFMNNRNN